MDDHTLWNLAGEAEDAIVAHYEPIFNRFSAASGLDDPIVGLLLPLADSQRLAILVARIVQASLNTPPPPDTWSIRLSFKLMPASSPPLPYIEQATSCLSSYRDDAHLAAWQPSGLSATALETLTLLWRGEADPLAAVCQRLSRRGHSPDVYAEALKELRTRGFVKGPEAAPRLTEAGRAFREQVNATPTAISSRRGPAWMRRSALSWPNC